MSTASLPTRPSIWSEVLTVSGRTNRARYWLIAVGATLLVVVMSILLAGVMFLLGVDPETSVAFQLAPLATLLVLLVPMVMAGVRRLHDRNKSGHWLWVLYGVPLIAGNLGNALVFSGQPAGYVLVLLATAVSIWFVVEIGFLRGTPGPNRYGPDPLGGTQA